MRRKVKLFFSLFLLFLLAGCVNSTNTLQDEAVSKLIQQSNLQVVDYEYTLKAIGNGTRIGANALLIDSRPQKLYKTSTIPSSINIPDDKFDEFYKQIKDVKKDKEIIVFCGGWSCTKSPKVANMLLKKGFKNVKLYQAGEPEWVSKNYNEVSTTYVKSQIEKNKAFIIDARPHKMFLAQSIPSSISIPDDKIDELKGNLPISKETKIITFCSGYECAKSHKIARYLIDNGYKKVSVYASGFPSWQKAGYAKKQVNQASIKQTNPFLGPIKKAQDIGTVDVEWFLQNYKTLKDVKIVDVRSTKERNIGKLDNTIHISLEELSSDKFLSLFPKDTYVIIHCAAGGRATQAYDLIQKSNLANKNKVVFLDAHVKCKANICQIDANEALDPTNW